MTTTECFRGMASRYERDGDLNVFLEWRHSNLSHFIVVCILVTIFNCWLSIKVMELRILIKEELVVFHWLTFCFILLCSLVSGHRACIYTYIYIYTLSVKISSLLIFISDNFVTKVSITIRFQDCYGISLFHHVVLMFR